MSAQHTPDSWDVRQAVVTGDDALVVDGNGLVVARCPFPFQNTRARLIAAAPDMLAALQELVRKADFGEPVPDWLNVWDEARSAIAKAEGR